MILWALLLVAGVVVWRLTRPKKAPKVVLLESKYSRLQTVLKQACELRLLKEGGVSKGDFGDESLADVEDFSYTIDSESPVSLEDLLDVRA
jgi:hypothetical protein